MLVIKNLKVSAQGKQILDDVTLRIKSGEAHAIMGPNGSGKSTLANAIMGNPKYLATGGEALFKGKSILGLKADKRAHAGIFLAFQYPKEIPGVTVMDFISEAAAQLRKARGLPPINPLEFRKEAREKLLEFGFEPDFLNRYINEGFSGGEKKKMEIAQMALLEPEIAILDEADSGLDVDGLKIIAKGIKKFIARNKSVIFITHNQKILNHIKPDFIHVMSGGKIVTSGDRKLGEKLEKQGFKWIQHVPNQLKHAKPA